MTKEITQEDMIKNYREVNAEQDYKIRMLEAENQRLKEQLDREIKINRKMKSALEKYASMEIELDDSYDSFTGTHWSDGYIDKETGDIFTKLAQEVLKEIDNKE